MHLLKLKFQPEKKTQSCFASVAVSRRDLNIMLNSGSKTLFNYFTENLPNIYKLARSMALAETNLPKSLIPETNPFTPDQILDDDFFAGHESP